MSVAPLQFLLLVFAGWVNRHQAEVVAYLQEENRVLREQLGGRRLRFTNAQRRRLAWKGRLRPSRSAMARPTGPGGNGGMTDNPTYLVIGGTGKTGRRVIDRLSARGPRVRAGSRSGRPAFDGSAEPATSSGSSQATVGVRLPHSAKAIPETVVEVPLSEVRPGDILWWPQHLALYAGNGWSIEALHRREGVIVRPARDPERAFRPPG